MDGFDRCHRLHDGFAEAPALDALRVRHVDRKTTELAPVKHVLMMIGSDELKHRLDIPTAW